MKVEVEELTHLVKLMANSKDLTDAQDPGREPIDSGVILLPQCWAARDGQIPRTSS